MGKPIDAKLIVADYTNNQHGNDIVTLMDAYATDPMGGGKPLSSFAKENLIKELSQLPHAVSVLCYVDNTPVGLVNCLGGFSTFACKPLINIHDLAVIEPFRGLGISQLLLNAVEEIAIQKGCCKITLEVLEGNNAARGAYSKYGFSSYQLDPTTGNALMWQKTL